MFNGNFINGNEYLVYCPDGELIGLNTNNYVSSWMTIDMMEGGDWAWVTFDNVDGDRLKTMIYLHDLRYYIEDESTLNS